MGAEDGLPQNSVRTVFQSRDGYVWLASEQAISRWDGFRFVNLTYRDLGGYVVPSFFTVYEASDGAIWIGTEGAGVIRYQHGNAKRFPTPKTFRPRVATGFLEARDGRMWILSPSFLTVHDRGRMESHPLPADVGVARDFTIASDGTVWIVAQNALLAYRAGTFTIVARRDAFANADLSGVASGPGDEVWVSTSGGLSRLRNGRVDGTWDFPSTDAPAPFEVAAWDGTTDVHVDRGGTVWVTDSARGALFRFREGFTAAGTRRLSPMSIGLRGKLRITESPEGALLIASGDGIHLLRDPIATPFTTDGQAKDGCVWSVLEDVEGAIWVGKQNGYVVRIAGGKEVLALNLGGEVLSLCEEAPGRMLAGTAIGAFRIENGVAVPIAETRGQVVKVIYRDRRGALWFGMRNGLLRDAGGQKTLFTDADGLPAMHISSMFEARNGQIWVGTKLGPAVFDGKRFRSLGSAAVPPLTTSPFYEDRDGTIWFCLFGRGLVQYQRGVFRTFGPEHGLPVVSVLGVIGDDRGFLWLATNNGVFRVRKSALAEIASGRARRFTAIRYSVGDGLPTSEAVGGTQPNIWRARDGRILLAMTRGVAVIHPARMHQTVSPRPVIESVVVDGSAKSTDRPLRFVSGKDLDLRYGAPTLLAPDRIRFRFQLEGLESEWLAGTAGRTVMVRSPAPGRYRFRVQAAADDEPWRREEASLAFVVIPRWWETFWLRALVVLALAGIVFAWLRFRVRLGTAEARVRANRAELSLLQVRKLESLGEMASGIAHDFNNTMMAALPWAEVIARRHKDDESTRLAARNIRAAVMRAAEVTRRLLDFAQPRDLAMRELDLRLLLHEQHLMLRGVISPNIALRLTISTDQAVVRADPNELARVVVNITLNARDALNEKGGAISIDLREPTETERTRWILNGKQWLVLSIADDGEGMSEDTVQRIFDPFYSTKGARGSGLGLAIAQKIIGAHGGRIEVESTLGLGTTFYLLLPRTEKQFVRRKDGTAMQTARVQDLQTLEGIRVMVVDDDDLVREGIGAMLELEGAAVTLFDAGGTALTRISSGALPDIIVLDLGLRDMQGDAVHEQVRRISRELPIVISTGYGERERIERLLADPRTRYVRKPYDIADLVKEILALLGRTS